VRIHKTLWFTALVACSAACGGGKGAEAASGESSSGGEAAEYAGAIASTDVEHGKEKFDDLCGDCHPDGGSADGPSLIATPHAASFVRKQIREGSGKMRPFPERRLKNDDMEAILAWLASVNAVK
jgi:mono/diheme cytochrome c family protein